MLRTATLLFVAIASGACSTTSVPAARPSRPAGTKVAPATADDDWLSEQVLADRLPPPIAAKLSAGPYVLFRVVNRPWARHVCRALRDEVGTLPQVYLHGDAHLEQYSFTEREYGLDDFDDSARGPAVVDLVRFVGSLELAARIRGWNPDPAIDQFFDGYRRALADATWRPPMPSVVAALRPEARRDQATFLEWAESLMVPLTPDQSARAMEPLERLGRFLASARPDLRAEEFEPKKVGRLELGLGSLLTPKYLVRVEGPTPDPDDDVILEAKELSDLSGIECLNDARIGEVARVITGSEQVGRLRHSVLSIVPGTGPETPTAAQRPWWIRTWDSTYGELQLRDITSPEDLAEIARDAGAQLGATNLRGREAEDGRAARAQELAAVTRLEPRLRALAREMSQRVVDAWEKRGRESFSQKMPTGGSGAARRR